MISIGKAREGVMYRPDIRLYRMTLKLLAFCLLMPALAIAAAGKVEFVAGDAQILDASGTARLASKGSEFDAGETLQTVDGRMQVKFIDGGYISLQPNTSFRVEEYHFNGQADGSERGIFHLIKGGLRAITGVIGHANKPNYRMDTPVATIGIRGTEFTASLNDAQRLLVKVGDGAVFMENNVGNLVLYKGQAGEVGELVKPTYSEQQPLLAAAGPSGATPEDAQQHQQREQAETQGFVLGDNKSISGGPCLGGLGGNCVWGSDPTERLISAYNLAGVQGQWSGNADNVQSSNGTVSANGLLNVDFSRYNATFVLTLTNPFDNPGWNSEAMTGTATGRLNPQNGRLSFADTTMGAGLGREGVCTNGGCDLIVNQGQLGGRQFSSANINFTVRANNILDSPQPFIDRHDLELQRVDGLSNLR
ncbi:FecR family protein [Methylobacillus methanolivorans]